MFTFLSVAEDNQTTQMTSNGFTRPRKKFLTKKWVSATEKQNMYTGKWYDVKEVVTPNSIRDVYAMVLKYAETYDALMIQNALPTGANDKRIARKSSVFTEMPLSKFIVLDVDGIELPEDISKTDIDAQAKHVLGLLETAHPIYFDKDMAFVAKGSSSAGMVNAINLHIYLENSVPINFRQMATVADEVNKITQETMGCSLIDRTLYDRVHPLYTANPLFEDVRDPFRKEPRIVLKPKGGLASIPPSTKEKELAKKSELTAEDRENINRYTGSDELTFSVVKILEDIRASNDEIYQKKVHHLMFTALEQGIGFKTIETAFTQAMQDHPKILSGERSIAEYLASGITYAMEVTKSRALRTVPDTVDVSTKPREEIDPEERKRIIFNVPVERVPTARPPTVEAARYLHLEDMPPRNKITFVKASLGTGKTTAVMKLLEAGKIKGRFLAITNTKALVNGNAKKFGAPADLAYLNKNKEIDTFRADPYGRMSTTIHSLHKFKDMIENGEIEFVFIDECDAVVNDLHNSSLIRERSKCIDTLRALLANTPYVMLSDGDISEETMQAYYHLWPSKELAVIEHKHNMLTDSVAYETKTEEALWINGVYESLKAGYKVLVVTDLGPNPINERVRSLEMLLDDKNLLGIHSESTKDEDVAAILEHTNDALEEQCIDGLVCSPSVVSGVDFHYFDVVCMITSKKIASPNLRFQAMRRCRRANEFWVYTDLDCSNFSTGYYESKYKENLDSDAIIKAKFALRRQSEYQNFRSNLRFLMMDQGCEIIVDSETPLITLEAMVKEHTGCEGAKAAEREDRIAAILSSREDYVPRKYNLAWETKLEIVHYYELEHPDNVLYEDVDEYLAQDIHKKMGALSEVINGGLWSMIFYGVSDFESFGKFLRTNAKEWYNVTGENTFTGYYAKKMNLRNAKYQSSRIGLKLFEAEQGIDPNFPQIKRWYRMYCDFVDIPIPKEFLTAEELAMASEKSADLAFGDQTVTNKQAAKSWASFL